MKLSFQGSLKDSKWMAQNWYWLAISTSGSVTSLRQAVRRSIVWSLFHYFPKGREVTLPFSSGSLVVLRAANSVDITEKNEQ